MNAKRWLLGACMLLIAGSAFADFKKGMAACAVKNGDLSRLECYDQLAVAMKLDGPQKVATSVKGKGKWRVDVKTNPMDDSKTVALFLKADSGKSKWNQPVGLIVRCQSNQTEMYIGWNDYLGLDTTKVTTRLGSQPAETKRWSLSTNNKSTFYPGSPISYLKAMAGEEKLVAQVTPYNASPVTAIFNIAGLENAMKPLRETCNW